MHRSYEAGLALPPSAPEDVALRLLDSTEAADQESVDAAWSAEIGSRVDDILNGKGPDDSGASRFSLSWPSDEPPDTPRMTHNPRFRVPSEGPAELCADTECYAEREFGLSERLEVTLSGGNASASVVRIGDTVRKPWLPTTDRTVGYVRALCARGIDLPETRGRDEEGRLILEHIPGELAMHRGQLDASLLSRIGALVGSVHDASVGLRVPDDWEVLLPVDHPDLVCHNDLATWNLIIDGDRLVFIDWDGAGPSTRLWDLAYAAISFGRLFADEDPDAAGGRLAAFLDGYGADDLLRAELPTTMTQRARAMYDLLRRSHEAGREPWARMYLEGHGELWNAAAAFIARHEQIWRQALR